MDRNQVIGFSLLGVLLVGYLWYNSYEQKQYQEQKRAKAIVDSIANARQKTNSIKAAAATPTVAPVDDSATAALRSSQPPAYYGQAQTVTLENKKLSLKFSTRGAYPVTASILGYKTYRGKPLDLFSGAGNQLSAVLPFDNGKSTADLYYTPNARTEPNGDKTIDFSADLGAGKKVDIIYTLPADDYMMQCSIVLTGIPANSLPLTWNTYGLHTEKDMDNERMNTQVYYRNKNGENDYFTVASGEEKILHNDDAMHWFGFRKQYFSSALVNDDGFKKTEVKYMAKAGDTSVVAQNLARMELPLKPGGNAQSATFKWFIGPNDFKTLRSYNIDLEDMVPLGYGIMAFVKYINKYAIIPLFYVLKSAVGNIDHHHYADDDIHTPGAVILYL